MAALTPTAPDQAERIVRLAWRVFYGERITTALIRRTFGVSKATAKRDAALLNRVLGGLPAPHGPQPARLIGRPTARLVALLGSDD